MRVKDLPVRERPRERALSAGPEALADRELLALLLGSGSPGCDAVDLAGRLIARHGGLYELSRADPQELIAQRGVGPAKAARVCAAFHLGRRARPPSAGAGPLTSTAALAEAAAPLLRGLRSERVVVVVCDTNAGILRASPLTQGAAGHGPLSVRDLLAYVLRCGGSAFGVAHNHPDGNPEPSPQDRLVTTRLREAAGLLGLRFLDHVIVTDETWRRVVDG